MRDQTAVSVRVVYLARLREAFLSPGETLRLPGGSEATVAGVLAELRSRGGAFAAELAPGRAIRVAVNHDMAQPTDAVRAGDARVGAVASFIGTVRDVNDDATVARLTLEHYPGMTEKALQAIVAEAKRRFDVYEVLVIHRVGELRPTDQIVLVAVTGAHRGEAFDACRFVMDYLKTRAPFWKKERTPQGERWVDARVSDDEAAARW
jgi:molybdopterin synthase catalytic subunit